MAKEWFKQTKFRSNALLRIQQANDIILEYRRDGLTLTLRQLYYQFVARALIANSQKQYKNLGSIVSAGRLAGLIDWDMIEDRTRNVHRVAAWDDPQNFMESVGPQYKIDLWDTQPNRVEVWIEKDALIGVVERPCLRRRVPFFACRGYTSQSEQYAAGKRFEEYRENGQTPVVIYLGDHDPSGLDMGRDHTDRLQMFSRGDVEVRRIALNFDQVEQYGPPPNPAKMTDSRARGYVKRYGRSSWELDALEPRVTNDLITSNIEGLMDLDAWDEAVERERSERDIFEKMAKKWPAVERHVRKLA